MSVELEKTLIQIARSSDEDLDPTAEAAIRKALGGRKPLLIMRAADALRPAWGRPMEGALCEAFDRMLINPIKADPSCHAKNAIVRALVRCELLADAAFLKGARHVQMEPVWGGREDTAAALRGLCARGLVQMGHGESLNVLAALLADPERTARHEAAALVAGAAQFGGVPLLRFKLLSGDDDPEVMMACCASLLSMDPAGSFEFVAALLGATSLALSEAAAFALGESRLPEALGPLMQIWQARRIEARGDQTWRRSVLLSVATLRQIEAYEALAALIPEASLDTAALICEILGLFAPHDDRLQGVLEGALAQVEDRDRRILILDILPNPD